MKSGRSLFPILFLAILGLSLACGPRPLPGPDAADLRPEETAHAFAAAVLEKSELSEAMRWADARAELAVRSQIGFLGASRRQAVYQVGIPSRKGSLWSVPIHIEALEVAGSRYQGELLLELGPEGRRVYGSSLVLERSDGVRFSI
jgi:hypothetical protein